MKPLNMIIKRKFVFKLMISVVIIWLARFFFKTDTNTQSIYMGTTIWPIGHNMLELPDKDTSNCILSLKDYNSSGQMVFHNKSTWFDVDMCEIVSKPSLLTRDKHTRFECTHFMNFRFNQGRTGNQMFQVSTLLGAAMYHGYTPVIDNSFPLREWFDLPNVINMELANCRTFTREASTRNWASGITQLSHDYNWTLKGYMHSWRYFEGAEPAIRKALTLKRNLVKKVKDFLKNTNTANRIENATAVCVHVRRGDYLDDYHIEKGYVLAPVRYLEDAMKYFRGKFKSVHFFGLSNDKKWLQENMNWDNVTISPFNSVGLDMALMSLCDHTIFTSGTFGWWGAWLSGGDVIYWTGHPQRGSRLDKRTCRFDLYPSDWIGMP